MAQVKKGAGIASQPPKKNAKKNKAQKLEGLTKGQNKQINQRQTQDLALGQQAGQMMPGIQDAYAQPFDYSQYGGPAEGDYKGWIENQMGDYTNAYNARMNPQFQQQMGDFEQKMANRGIPMGSELYNREKTRLEQSQNDARQQADAANMQNATSAASQFFGIGTQAQDRSLGLGQAARNAPLSEYNQLNAAQSPMMMQNLGYSQQRGLASQAGDIARSMPRGGGGGGGGSGPLWSQYGFSSPMEYDAYKTQQSRDQAQWAWQNDPQYKQKGNSVNPWMQFGGQILGAGIQGYAQNGGFNGLFS